MFDHFNTIFKIDFNNNKDPIILNQNEINIKKSLK